MLLLGTPGATGAHLLLPTTGESPQQGALRTLYRTEYHKRPRSVWHFLEEGSGKFQEGERL